MVLERERKFRLHYMPALVEERGYIPIRIRQAYLMLLPGKQLRVRIVNDATALICLKLTINDIDRHEYEYEIPITDGLSLYNSTGTRLEKTRISFPSTDIGGEPLEIFIDSYPDGLQVVEIEYHHEELSKQFLSSNSWIGEEITTAKEYSNIRIALNNAGCNKDG